jgi:hypothetical protein
MSLIKRLEELEAKATPGPWYADTGDSYSPIRSDSGPICDCDVVEYDTEQGKLNSVLIAEMRNAFPILLAALKAAHRFAEGYRQFHEVTGDETCLDELKAWDIAMLESFMME